MSLGKHRTGAAAWPISHDKAGMSVDERVKDHMLTLLKRHQVQTLLAAATTRSRLPTSPGYRCGAYGVSRPSPRSSASMTARIQPNAGSGDRARWRRSVPWCRSWWSRSTKRLAHAEPRDLAWLLASYARDGLARVEAAEDAPANRHGGFLY